jgi:hypothetical protein
VSSAALEEYLSGVDPAAAPVVRALDEAVRAAHPGFDVAIKYRILTYALDADWRHWVCAVQATGKGVCLRFLYGVLLADPLGVLRAGTSVLETWDMGLGDTVDAEAVGGYVREAVAKYAEYRADAPAIEAAAKAAGPSRRRPRRRPPAG